MVLLPSNKRSFGRRHSLMDNNSDMDIFSIVEEHKGSPILRENFLSQGYNLPMKSCLVIAGREKMRNNKIEKLLSQAVSPTSFVVEGRYTFPRAYGVYRITRRSSGERQWRFGNHPVRETELVTAYGGAEVVAIFLQREQAKELSSLLNNR